METWDTFQQGILRLLVPVKENRTNDHRA
jgi:hypothetical protein